MLTDRQYSDWIDWRRMHPQVRPEDLDPIDRAQIVAQQQPTDANKPIRET